MANIQQAAQWIKQGMSVHRGDSSSTYLAATLDTVGFGWYHKKTKEPALGRISITDALRDDYEIYKEEPTFELLILESKNKNTEIYEVRPISIDLYDKLCWETINNCIKLNPVLAIRVTENQYIALQKSSIMQYYRGFDALESLKSLFGVPIIIENKDE